jgi:nuclear pore complex protein Nup98-Nup96
VNVCSSLDWKRCVAVHLWYMLPPTASVADALAKYQDAFQVGGLALWSHALL